MGLFDYVNVEILCPYCNQATLKDFQSKSSGCNMDTLDPDCVANFYGCCPNCHEWVEYTRLGYTGKDPRATPFNEEEIAGLGFTLLDPPKRYDY